MNPDLYNNMRTRAERSRETITVSYGSRFTGKISSHCTAISKITIYLRYAVSVTKQKKNAPKRFDRESDAQKTNRDDETDNNNTAVTRAAHHKLQSEFDNRKI